MKRLAGGLMMLGLLGGSTVALGGPYMAGYWNRQSGVGVSCGGIHQATHVPNAIGPWGQPVEMVAPYTAKPPNGAEAARAMLSQHLPLDIVQQIGLNQGGLPGAIGPRTTISPPGVPGIPMVPGYPSGIQLASGPPGAVAAVNALTQPGQGGQMPAQRTEIRFVSPAGMKISWYGTAAGGRAGLTTSFIEAPGRYNFVQAAVYRLKLSDIPNRPGLELYPTLEVVPSNKATATFLAHAAVPVSFTEDDFEQIASGNFVVKVIYLPDPRFQDLAVTGVGEIVSSPLEPGVDPIAEACRRGSILAIVRVGNIDLEAPNTPAMDAPSPYTPVPKQAAMPGQHGMMGPGSMMAPPMMNPGRGMMVAPNGPMPPQMQPGMPPMQPGMPIMQPGMPMAPTIPTNRMPLQPPPQVQPQQPAGPVGMLPGATGVQQVKHTQPAGKVPTQAELAAQSAPAVNPPEKKPAPRRWLFGWGASSK